LKGGYRFLIIKKFVNKRVSIILYNILFSYLCAKILKQIIESDEI